ncbi:MAG: S-layer homology domain-containing protein [Actinomycetota bacterium]
MLRSVVVTATIGLLAASLAWASPAAAGNAIFDEAWSHSSSGWNRSSSPVIADIDGDGQNEVVIGHQDGNLRAYEADGSLKWSSAAVPGINAGCNNQSYASAIDSSPAVADLDKDGTAEVVVGVGSTWQSSQNGGVIAFDGVTGAIEWQTRLGRDMGNVWENTPNKDGWCEGVYSTPAIGDIDGDGWLDVVFAAWDFYIWAVDRNGNALPGFPFDNDDSVWSSPSLFDIDADGDMEIFIGGDTYPGGNYDHLGGVLRAIDWKPAGLVNLWNAEANEVFHSTGAIGDINGDGLHEIVIATGHNWRIECGIGHPACGPGDGSDTNKVFAFHLHDGSPVPGFPVSHGGTVIGSPALGDIDNDGQLEVVVGSEDTFVYAWNGDGSLHWKVQVDDNDMHTVIGPGPFAAGAAIADLQGDGGQDVAIGGSTSLVLLDGATGASLEAGIQWPDRVDYARSFESTPAIGMLNGERHIVFSSFDTPGNNSRLAAYTLPASSADDDWPMFARDIARSGTAVHATPTCGFSINGTFCDVADGHIFGDAIDWMVSNSVTAGLSNFLYGPNETLTRAQMVTFLWRDAGSPFGNPAHSFTDVPDGEFYAEAVRWASANNITQGTSASNFSPGDTVTRAQLVTFLWRREGRPAAPSTTPFIDVATGAYYHQAVAWASTNNITQGTSATNFSPDDPVTRGQAAALLYRTFVANQPA